MAVNIQVKYFNSFWLKKVCPAVAFNGDPEPDAWKGDLTFDEYYLGIGQWPGLPWTPTYITASTYPDPAIAGQPLSYPPFAWYNGYASAGRTPGVMQGLGGFVELDQNFSVGGANWYIEESVIKGGFNNTRLSLGVRAYTVDENPKGQDRNFSVIHSGILNTRTGYNETNVFSVATNIEKDLEQRNGSIEQLYVENTLLLVFQEAKVSKILINKNALYSGDQGSQDTTNISFFGQLNPYAGEYGISKNGQSFAQFGYRKYFTDRDRGVVCRLSMDGITEISAYGMVDWFRDNLNAVGSNFSLKASSSYTINSINTDTNLTFTIDSEDFPCGVPNGSIVTFILDDGQIITTNNFVSNVDATNTITLSTPYLFTGNEVAVFFSIYKKPRIIGGWDVHNQNYVISLQQPGQTLEEEGEYYTLNFDETVQGWVSFYSYKPIFVGSLKSKYYSFYECGLYEHYFETATPPYNKNYGKFYGVSEPYDSNITFIFNPSPTVVKNFKTISYEGGNGWEADMIVSDWQEFDPDGTWNIQPPTFNNSVHFRDMAEPVLSYIEGFYIDESGMPNNAGFVLKENKYVADIVSGNTKPRYNEVLFGSAINYPTNPDGSSLATLMTGIKGYVATVKLSIDKTTDPGGRKEIFSTSSQFVLSSN